MLSFLFLEIMMICITVHKKNVNELDIYLSQAR